MIENNDGKSDVLTGLLARMQGGGNIGTMPMATPEKKQEKPTQTQEQPQAPQGNYPWGSEWISPHNDLLFSDEYQGG